jgi:predicted RecB family nuclease
MAENYVLGEEIDLSMPGNKIIFDQIKKVLDSNVDNVIASESTLISHKLKVAGTTDLIAEYDGKLSIIDYKTASKRKRKEWIENYFLQSAMYSYMLWEMTGIMAKQIVIIIGIDSEPEAQVFKVNPADYIEKAAQMCRDYHDLPR